MTTIADLRDAQRDAQRDSQGRFLPGQSGNPAGRPRGARNRKTILAEALAEGEDAAIARRVIDKALAGDAVAARFCLDRLNPKPRGRAIHLDLPQDLSSGGAVVAAFNAALRAMAAGEITPDEAVTVARFLEGRLKALQAWQLERKMTWSHTAPPIPGDVREAEDVDAERQDFFSPLRERMGEGEAPLPERRPTGRGTTPSPRLSPGGEEMIGEEADVPQTASSSAGPGVALSPHLSPRREEMMGRRDERGCAADRLYSACNFPPGITPAAGSPPTSAAPT
jgi:Family of unknown function (DUF5681)